MPAALQTYIDAWYSAHGYFTSDLYNAGNYIQYLGEQIEAQNWSGANSMCLMAANYFRDAALHFTTGSPSMRTTMKNTLQWINDNWPGVAVIDMSAILNAMWNATPYQCLLFIPMIDAMRGAISEKSVTIESMESAMRRFT